MRVAHLYPAEGIPAGFGGNRARVTPLGVLLGLNLRNLSHLMRYQGSVTALSVRQEPHYINPGPV